MKKVLIICAAGMSSSMLARKVTEFFAARELPIEVDATTVSQASDIIDRNEFDLYLISPQAKMNYDVLAKRVEKYNKPIENIPPTSYLPTEAGINAIARQIFTVLKDSLKKKEQ